MDDDELYDAFRFRVTNY